MRPNLAVLRSAIGPMLTEHEPIERRTGWTTDPDGFEIPIIVTLFDGPVLVRPEPAVEVRIGGVEFTRARYDVTFPAGTGVKVGDVLVMGTVPHEPELTGVRIRLSDTPLDSWPIAKFCKGERAT